MKWQGEIPTAKVKFHIHGVVQPLPIGIYCSVTSLQPSIPKRCVVTFPTNLFFNITKDGLQLYQSNRVNQCNPDSHLTSRVSSNIHCSRGNLFTDKMLCASFMSGSFRKFPVSILKYSGPVSILKYIGFCTD